MLRRPDQMSKDKIRVKVQPQLSSGPDLLRTFFQKNKFSLMRKPVYAIPVAWKELDRGVAFYILNYEGTDVEYWLSKEWILTSDYWNLSFPQALRGKRIGKHQL